MGWLSDFFQNPLKQGFDTLAQLPGTPEGGMTGLYKGVNGDLSWNPYDQEGPSVWEYGAAGTKLPENNQDRQWGRMFGSAIGNYFTAGALSPYLGGAGAAAASSGLWAGAQTAGQGGDSGEIGESMFKNAALSGLSQYSPNYAGAVGVTNPTYAGALNGGINGAAMAGLQGKNVGQGAGMGAVGGGLNGMMSSGATPEYGQSKAPWATENNAFAPGGEYGSQSSAAPWAQGPSPSFSPASGASVSNSPAMQQGNTLTDGVKKLLGSLGGEGGLGGKVGNLSYGDMAQGLMGMYGGYKQRKQAKELMGMVGGRRDAYESQLRGSLRAKDAASGKRSNYAGRETQLQASLAELDSRNAPMMNQLSNQSLGGLFGMLQSGAGMGGRAGMFGPQYMRGYQAPAQATPGQFSLPDFGGLYEQHKKQTNPFGGG